jgi:hypothetical protein
MKTREMSLLELNDRAMKALARALGPVGMIRFLQQYDTGHGDYTRERHQWLDKVPFEEVAEGIFRRQRERGRQVARSKTGRAKTG